MNTLDAAYNVVHDHPGGADALAPRVGKNSTTLSHEVSGTGAAKLGLLTAEKITQRTGDLRILACFAANCGQMLVPLPGAGDAKGDACMVHLADVIEGFGKLCRETAVDLADGKINDNELGRIDTEIGLVIARLHAMRKALADLNQVEKDARAVKGGC
jgi:hypothetical protein